MTTLRKKIKDICLLVYEGSLDVNDAPDKFFEVLREELPPEIKRRSWDKIEDTYEAIGHDNYRTAVLRVLEGR